MSKKTVPNGGMTLTFEVDDTGSALIDKLLVDAKTAADALDAAEKQASTAEQALEAEKQKSAKAATDHAAALEAEKAKTAKMATDHASELATAKSQIQTPEQIQALAAERSKVVGDAGKLAPQIATDGKSVDQIRREAITAICAKDGNAKTTVDAMLGADHSKASPDLVTAAFNALAVSAKAADAARAAGDSAVSNALLGSPPPAPTAPKKTARDAWIEKQQAK